MSKPKIQTEQQSRTNVLNIAKGIGQLEAAKEIFAKYDRILAKHQDPKEREQIGAMGAAEIYRLIGFQSGLSINGVDIIPKSDKFIEVQKAEEKEMQDKIDKENRSNIIIPEIKL